MALVVSAITTTARVGSLPRADSLQFTRLCPEAFLGVNDIVWSDGILFLATTQDLFRSLDTGRTWNAIAQPLGYMHITGVRTRGDTVYALASNGQVHRTVDHGLTWSAAPRSGSSSHSFERIPSDVATWTVRHTDSSIVVTHAAGITAELLGIDGTAISDAVAGSDRIYVARRREAIECIYLPGMQSVLLPTEYLTGEYISSLLVNDSMLYAGIRGGTGNVHRIGFNRTGWEPVQNAAEVMGVDVVSLTHGERGIYVCSRENGVLFVERGTNILRSISNGLRRSIVQSLSRLGSDYIVGSRAQGVYLMDGKGASIRPFARNLPQSNEYVVACVDSTVVVVLSSGVLMRTDDRGASWRTLDTLFPNSVLNNMQARGGVLYASTTTGVRVSRDKGETWASLHPDLDGENVNDVVIGDSLIVLIATSATLLLRPDGSIERFIPPTQTTYPPRMSDALFHDGRVFGVGYPGIFISEDNGRTWHVHTHEKTVVFRTLAVIGTRLLVITDAGILLAAKLP